MKNKSFENLSASLEEFNSLKSWRGKVEYFEKCFEISYVQFLIKFNDLYQLHPFKVEVDESEWESMNKWLLKNCDKETDERKLLIDFIYLQTQFRELQKDDPNKLKTELLKELDRIDQAHKLGEWIVEFNAFNSSYKQYLDYKISPDYSKICPSLNTISYENGKNLAVYKIYLEDLLSKFQDSENQVLQELTTAQIVLILDYTGVLGSLKMDQTDIGRLFGGLLNKNAQNIRANLGASKIKKLKNLENLRAVQNFIQQNDLKKYLSVVAKEIQVLEDQ